MNSRRRAFILVPLAALLAGCGINQPLGPQIAPIVHSSAPSLDGGQQNSGIIGIENGQFHVTAHFHDRYIAIAAIYGNRFAPVLDATRGVTPMPDGTFHFDGEAIEDFERMNRWRRSESQPSATHAPQSLLKRIL